MVRIDKRKKKQSARPADVWILSLLDRWVEGRSPQTWFMILCAWAGLSGLPFALLCLSQSPMALWLMCSYVFLALMCVLTWGYPKLVGPPNNEHRYTSIEDLILDCKQEGLEGGTETILAIDFSSSNLQTGSDCFHGMSMHTLGVEGGNPYEQCISMLGTALADLDKDNVIPVYGFGDSVTKDHSVFALHPAQTGGCAGYDEVLARYRDVTQTVLMEGPTSLVPAIEKAIETVRQEVRHHVLIIITDGDICDDEATRAAIVEASNYAISIIAIGVGDGEFRLLDTYDRRLRGRQFDNFTFVKWADFQNTPAYKVDFTIAALQELPDQMHDIKQLGLLSSRAKRRVADGANKDQ